MTILPLDSTAAAQVSNEARAYKSSDTPATDSTSSTICVARFISGTDQSTMAASSAAVKYTSGGNGRK